jgi:GDPmannose 4,6-dehydratase
VPENALITGVSGQDGYYLAHLLRAKRYNVFGLVHENDPRRSMLKNSLPFVRLIRGNLADFDSLVAACEASRPAEVYNLASQSRVDLSFNEPELTWDITGKGVLRLLTAVHRVAPRARFYQASSSEMFGPSHGNAHNETSSFDPWSPYAEAKVFAHESVRHFRESGGHFACSGICFNHESERRGMAFVTRKVTRSVARICSGLQKELVLGNINSRRDWGFAGEYVSAMWLMMQEPEPRDFVIATGVSRSVEDLLNVAFGTVGLDWREHVVVDHPEYLRNRDVPDLIGDPTKASEFLGWKASMSFEALVRRMLVSDLNAVHAKMPALLRSPGRAARAVGPGGVSGRTFEIRTTSQVLRALSSPINPPENLTR